MDTVLARTFSVRPENKIAMRCPSWPDTPLHQYFGAARTNRRDRDFVLSSLGYVRLYQYCCPCEKLNDQPAQEASQQSSFVHLEERMRSDGPFILYRRPSQRRLCLGLTERAREKRLLKYYKYFQGFQRKLQVSRQFQQNLQKSENKAKVKKIINCYKSKAVTLPEASVHSPPQNKQPFTAPTTSSYTSSAEESMVSMKGFKDAVASAKIGKKGSKIQKATKAGDSTCTDSAIAREFADMAAVLTSIDSNANKFLKRKERCTIIAPTLATIEENAGDCDISESEQNLDKTISDSPGLFNKSDSVYFMEASGTSTAQPKSTCENKEPTRLRGILKYPKQTNVEPVPQKAEPKRETSSLALGPKATSSDDLQTTKQQPTKRKLRKFNRAKTAFAGPGLSGILVANVGSEGQLMLTEDATLKKKVSQKVHRSRPVLKRSSVSSIDAAEKEDDVILEPTPGEPEDDGPGQSEEKPTSEKAYSKSSRKATKNVITLKLPEGRKSNKPPHAKTLSGNMIKFNGWDYGTTLGTHVLKTLPGEQDLYEQLLKRAEKLQWGVNPQTIVTESSQETTPQAGTDTESAKAYLQEHSILQVFEHFTKALVNEQPDRPLEMLQGFAQDLTVRHEQMSDILKDLKAMREKPRSRSLTASADSYMTDIKQKHAPKPRYRIGVSVKENTSSSVVTASSEQRAVRSESGALQSQGQQEAAQEALGKKSSIERKSSIDLN